jgi:serine/threonine-protein kinase
MYPSTTATGFTPYAAPPQPAENRTDRRVPRWQWLLATATVIALLGVALVVAYAIVRDDYPSPSNGALPPVQSSSNPATVTETTTTTAPTTTQSTTRSTSTAAGRMPGTDSQGFTGSYARCDSGSSPAAEAQTTKSQVVICQSGGGSYYYRAVRMSDGATLQLADATRTGGGFDVTNPGDGTRYQVRPNAVNIISSSGSETEPVVQYASN